MKKILLISVLAIFAGQTYAQYLLPVSISTDPKNIEIAFLGSLSSDGASGGFIESMSTQADFGYALNAMVRRGSGKFGPKISYKQFIVNINPLIVDWKPFQWNNLAKHPVDSFSIQKLPFSDNSLLHIGVRHNSIAKIKMGGKDQRRLHSFWADMFWSPYSLDYNGVDLKFQTFNINAGYQYSFFKTNVPIVKTFLIGFSPQVYYTGINESQAFQGSFETTVGTNSDYSYAGKQYVGAGGKFIIQMDHLNVFVEGRQYYGIDEGHSGQKFSVEPTIIVGAHANVKFFTRSPKKAPDGGWE